MLYKDRFGKSGRVGRKGWLIWVFVQALLPSLADQCWKVDPAEFTNRGKIAIMSDKPQTTRNTIKTIVTTDDCQIVFMDTPGLHRPKNKLGDYMVKSAMSTLREVDAILYLVEAKDKTIGPGDARIIEDLKKVETPVLLLINKVDLVEKPSLLPLIEAYSQAMDFVQIIPVSALLPQTKELVMDEIIKLLPEGEPFFPEDMLTDQPEKVLVQEIIREKSCIL